MPFDDDQARALEWMVKRALDDVTQPIRDGLENLRVKLEETESANEDLEKELKDIKNLLRLAFDKTRSTMPKIINGYIPYPGNDTLEEEANPSNEDV
uniref:Uncharacterized protein n=1 Tax=Romanomermis culicivorax TaxID=13658 RepID=A0A915J608_ROMCU